MQAENRKVEEYNTSGIGSRLEKSGITPREYYPGQIWIAYADGQTVLLHEG